MSVNPFGPQGWTSSRISDLTGKTFVITGTTSGTGFEAARILLSKGARVVMLNRNAEKATATINSLKEQLGDKVDVVNVVMDLAKQASVKQAAAELLGKVARIDALICNAAIAQVPRRELTVDDFESQLGVNHFGHFTLQALLFPLIKASEGRIVTVGSLGYDMGLKTIKFDDINWDNNYTPNDAYSQSKLAQIMCVYALQDKLQQAGVSEVKAYACHPGSSRTSLIATSGSFMMRAIFGLMKLTPLTQPAENGAYPMLMCATEPDLDQAAFYGPTGRSNWVGPVGPHKLEPHAQDKAVAEKLWHVSEEVTGVTWAF